MKKGKLASYVIIVILIVGICVGTAYAGSSSKSISNYEEKKGEAASDPDRLKTTDTSQTEMSSQSQEETPKHVEYAKAIEKRQKVESLGEAGFSAKQIIEILDSEESTTQETVIALKSAGYEYEEISSALSDNGHSQEEIDSVIPKVDKTAASATEEETQAQSASSKTITQSGTVAWTANSGESSTSGLTGAVAGTIDLSSQRGFNIDSSGNVVKNINPVDIDGGVPRTAGATMDTTADGQVAYFEELPGGVNGKETSRALIGYDSKGNAIKHINLDENGDVTSSAEYVNDSKGNLLEARHYYKSGDIRLLEKYDGAGNKLASVKYSQDRHITEIEVNTYDGDGNRILSQTYNETGELQFYITSTFDENGSPVQDLFYDKDDALMGQMDYTMDMETMKGVGVYTDKDGKERVKVEFEWTEHGVTNNIQIKDGKIVEHTFKEYDSDGQLVKETHFTPEGGIKKTIENTYEGGKQVHQTIFDAQGVATGATQYYYNSQNQMIGFINYNPNEKLKQNAQPV